MKLSELSVNRSITSIMLFIGIIVLGFVSLSKTPLDLFPEIDYPVVVVITDYTGAGPKEVESSITRMIEESFAGINNVEEISSTSKEGSSMVMVKFAWGTDMAGGVSDLRERLDIIKKFFPDGAETPIVIKFDVSLMPIMTLVISGDKSSAMLRDYAENDLKNSIEKIDGVASANVEGGSKYEVRIDLIKNRLEAYGLNVDSIIRILQIENMNISGGEIYSLTKKYTLRTKGEFSSLYDIRNVIVAVKNSTPVYLKDIARVYETPKETQDIFRINGENGVGLRINKQSDKNTVLVSRNIMKDIEEIRKSAPKGIDIRIAFNSAEYIEQSINNVISNAIIGGLIAVFVVFLFLRSFKSSLILGLSIPISIIATFIAMYYFDISLNMMSMGGLAIGVGMLIDNSIVILENIYRYREKGARNDEAAKLGADEMAMAITASTLTTIVVFVPFLFSSGFAGQLFKPMALTISFSLLCSLLVALTLVPMLSSKIINRINFNENRSSGRLAAIYNRSENLYRKVESLYSVAINYALQHRKSIVLGSIAAVAAGMMLLIFSIGKEFIPEQDDAHMQFEVKLPVGTNLNTTAGIIYEVEKRIKSVLQPEEYKVISGRAGSSGGFAAAFGGVADHVAQFEILFEPVSKRKRTEKEIQDLLRKELAALPGAKVNFNLASQSFGGGNSIQIEVYGYDFDQAAVFSNEIVAAIKDIPELTDITISREEGLPEKVITVDRNKTSSVGLNASQIASMVKNNIAGSVATTYRMEGKEFDIHVQLRERDRATVNDIKSMQIMTPAGIPVPLGNLITVNDNEGPSGIERKKQQRVTYIKCTPKGTNDLNGVVNKIQQKIDKLVKPKNFFVNITGSYKDMQDTFKDLGLALMLAIVLIYIIMASQFESLGSPFIIMFSIPTLIFGVSVFLVLTGTTFNAVTFMGVLMLSGIVVNNAIVLVDYTNILRARGFTTHGALIEAGTKRLRPILMTTFTTIFGLVPMALGMGEGGELTMPLAHAVIGGLSSSFIFTLILIPVLYSYFEDFKSGIKFKIKQLWG
ncbi:MAG: efflux RND transporter permease subunit [Spirochaetes bacterium]|nr:efflux RND transporter permease subunit [Spirochaetota bacterium]